MRCETTLQITLHVTTRHDAYYYYYYYNSEPKTADSRTFTLACSSHST